MCESPSLPARSSMHLSFLSSCPTQFAMAHCAWETDAWQRGVANADPARLRDALKSGSIGFSFSGGGFFMPYNVGAIEVRARRAPCPHSRLSMAPVAWLAMSTHG